MLKLLQQSEEKEVREHAEQMILGFGAFGTHQAELDFLQKIVDVKVRHSQLM